MKTETVMFSLFLSSLTLLIAFDVNRAASDEWRVGFSRIAITPQELVWLYGYSNRTMPAQGKVHDLWAKAFVLQGRDKAKLVVITLDLGSINRGMLDAVITELATHYSIPRSHVVLNCSHTHCAPETSDERRIFHGYSDKEEEKIVRYESEVNRKLRELIASAMDDLSPARLSIGKASSQFAINRRDPSGVDVDGVVDHEVPVLRVVGPDGKLRGVLFGYACHNTTLDSQLYCGDYAGFAQYELESKFPGATAMFVNGCSGDQNPQPRHGPNGLEYAVKHGKELAAAVETALAGELQELTGPLKVAYAEAELALENPPNGTELRQMAASKNPALRRKAQYLLSKVSSGEELPRIVQAPIHVATFGEQFIWIFLSGETVVDYSIRCKSEFARSSVWVSGYCDYVFGYLPSRRVLLEGGYEGKDGVVYRLLPAAFQTNVEHRMFESLNQLVAECRSTK